MFSQSQSENQGKKQQEEESVIALRSFGASGVSWTSHLLGVQIFLQDICEYILRKRGKCIRYHDGQISITTTMQHLDSIEFSSVQVLALLVLSGWIFFFSVCRLSEIYPKRELVREPHHGTFYCTVQWYLPVGSANGAQSTDPSAPSRGFHQVHLCSSGNMLHISETSPGYSATSVFYRIWSINHYWFIWGQE